MLTKIFLHSYSIIFKGFIILLLTPLVLSNINPKNGGSLFKPYSKISQKIQSSDLLTINVHKNCNIRHCSSLEQIRYYKSNHQHLIPLKINKMEKNTGTISLLSYSFQNNNNTTYSKPKNRIIQKLDKINKKLIKTLKQLQATTSKSFINFNFNYTQLRNFSTITPSFSLTSISYYNSKSEKNRQEHKQKESNSIYSSIPKSCLGYLKRFQKNKIEVVTPSNLNTNEHIYVSNNENNHEILSQKSTLEIKPNNCYFSHSTSHKSHNIKPSPKTTMKIHNDDNAKTITKQVQTQYQTEDLIKETILVNPLNKENKKIHISNNKLPTDQHKENKFEENSNSDVIKEKEENRAITTDDNKNFNSLKYDKNFFASPQSLALVLFILYATYMF